VDLVEAECPGTNAIRVTMLPWIVSSVSSVQKQGAMQVMRAQADPNLLVFPHLLFQDSLYPTPETWMIEPSRPNS